MTVMRCNKALGRLVALYLVAAALAVPTAGQEDSNCEVSDLDEYDFMVRERDMSGRLLCREGEGNMSSCAARLLPHFVRAYELLLREDYYLCSATPARCKGCQERQLISQKENGWFATSCDALISSGIYLMMICLRADSSQLGTQRTKKAFGREARCSLGCDAVDSDISIAC